SIYRSQPDARRFCRAAPRVPLRRRARRQLRHGRAAPARQPIGRAGAGCRRCRDRGRKKEFSSTAQVLSFASLGGQLARISTAPARYRPAAFEGHAGNAATTHSARLKARGRTMEEECRIVWLVNRTYHMTGMAPANAKPRRSRARSEMPRSRYEKQPSAMSNGVGNSTMAAPSTCEPHPKKNEECVSISPAKAARVRMFASSHAGLM